MNLLYLVCFCIIAFYWRPTSNNARYGLEELPDGEHAYDLEMAVTGETHGQDMHARRAYADGTTDNPVVFELNDGSTTADGSEASPRQTNGQQVFSMSDEDEDGVDLSGYQAARTTMSMDRNSEDAQRLRQEFSKLQ
jgi:hypothetical protein